MDHPSPVLVSVHAYTHKLLFVLHIIAVVESYCGHQYLQMHYQDILTSEASVILIDV